MKILRTLAAVLREIFEESAFERYCAREGVERDRAAYAKFVREAGPPKPRCC